VKTLLDALRSSAIRRWLAAGALLLLAAPFADAATLQEAADLPNRWGPNPTASDYGERYDDLFALITWLISVSFGIMLILLILPVIRDRSREGHKASFDHGSSLQDKRFTAIVSVIVFIVLDAWVLVIAVKDLREAYWNIPRDTEDAYRVEILAQQWSWNFRATGADGEFGTADDIVTINDLTIPQGRPVVFNMTSKDVIHSFYVPDMRMKRDANPGAINEAWFRPITAGNFDILCAELCGFAHYQMGAKLHVLSPEDFPAWEQDASMIAVAAFDAEDTEAQWAWDWKE